MWIMENKITTECGISRSIADWPGFAGADISDHQALPESGLGRRI
jgi:hypothetical protein